MSRFVVPIEKQQSDQPPMSAQRLRTQSGGDTVANSWVIRFQPRAAARLRLFCLHHAGGSAAEFRTWWRHLPAEIEVCAIQLPGHANRRHEPPCTEITLLTQTLAEVLHPYCDRPFALFGHSLGGLLAFELTRYLQQQALPLPRHLFISAWREPHLPNPRACLWRLPDRELIDRLTAEWPWFSQEMAGSPFFQERALPALRADLRLVDGYVYSEAPRLGCPLTCFGGAQDARVPEHALAAWRQHTQCAFHLRLFAGGHFYLRSNDVALIQAIMQQLVIEP